MFRRSQPLQLVMQLPRVTGQKVNRPSTPQISGQKAISSLTPDLGLEGHFARFVVKRSQRLQLARQVPGLPTVPTM